MFTHFTTHDGKLPKVQYGSRSGLLWISYQFQWALKNKWFALAERRQTKLCCWSDINAFLCIFFALVHRLNLQPPPAVSLKHLLLHCIHFLNYISFCVSFCLFFSPFYVHLLIGVASIEKLFEPELAGWQTSSMCETSEMLLWEYEWLAAPLIKLKKTGSLRVCGVNQHKRASQCHK